MDHLGPVLIATSFVLAAALLWLAKEVTVLAAARPRNLRRALTVAAATLGACALWWPGHAMTLDTLGVDSSLSGVAVWLPGLALWLLAFATATLAQRKQPLWVLFGSAATLVAAYLHALFAAPGMFRLSSSVGVFGEAAAVGALCAALIALHLRPADKGIALRLKAASVLVASGIACMGPALAPRRVFAGAWAGWPELLMLAGLIYVAAVTIFVLVHGQKIQADAEAIVRPTRPQAPAADSLTGLPTRLYFEHRLASAAKVCDTQKARLAVFFIDLDGFKPVNDTFGHSSGDRVLEQVGQRLKAISRGADVAARVGGDEFLLLMSGITSQEAVSHVAVRLIDALSKPYRIEEREVVISCSVGIAVYPEGCSPGKLIARADAAMYSAKRAGGSRHCFYSPEMDADVQQNFEMARDLRNALANNQLELFFQPKIDAQSGKVTAAEALLRWQHPKRGMVMPAQFIPLAERSGLIGPLGNWVIEAACKQARAWRDKGLRMRVAINLSAQQMRQDDIADRIGEALTRHRIHPSLLTCEITETAAMEDTRATQEAFRRLGELGAHLSIDDFGTGYSSLSYLRQLPAEELKIDRSFVMDVDTSPDARAVVDAVVKLAHALGLKVVAEGVETPRQREILIELGCDELQGFLFAKPMSARALLLWAMDDRDESSDFRPSLFGETQTAASRTASQH